MNRISRLSLACVVLGGSLAGSAYADPVTINITGNVLAAPCIIDGASSVPVDLGDIQAPALATAGTASGWKQLKLNLKDCPATTTKVVAVFKGTPDATDANLYANAGTAGKNVAIELAVDGTNIDWVNNGRTLTANVNATTHAAVFALAARAKSVKGAVTPGTISGVIQVDFTYQ